MSEENQDSPPDDEPAPREDSPDQPPSDEEPSNHERDADQDGKNATEKKSSEKRELIEQIKIDTPRKSDGSPKGNSLLEQIVELAIGLRATEQFVSGEPINAAILFGLAFALWGYSKSKSHR